MEVHVQPRSDVSVSKSNPADIFWYIGKMVSG